MIRHIGVIVYNPDYSPSTRGLFNGNISETHWITANDNKNRNYRYEYDALNRIVDAINIGENEGHRYRVINITYDKNGNLLGLHRNGWKNEAVSYGNIDVLEYSYDSGNKLTKVKDYGSGDYGFKDGTNTGNDYAYDVNGNLTSDANKQITSILYNHLNLPTEVKFNNLNTRKINYIYGADGTKLQKLVNDNGNETATEYAGNYIYENNVLQFFNTAEGYVTSDNNGGYDYVYQYKDHLGNIRLSYTDADGNGTINPNTEIVKESNYYPFGLKHKGYNGGVSSLGNSVANRFMFGGKESSEELDLNTYDFGARNYDSALGRWMNLDPLAELMRRHSPYNYAFNNPVYYIDPDGMAPIDNSGLDYDATTSRDEKYGETTVDLRKTRSLKPWRFAASSRDDDWSNDESDDSEESSPEGDEEDCCEDEVNGLLKGIGQGLIDLSVTTNPVYNTINEISKLFIQGGLIPEIEVSEGELPTYIVGAVILAIIEPGPGGEAKWLLKGLKNPKKIVVIGEDMLERVIPFAKKNGFKYFKPRGKNPANWMKNQKQWIYRQIKDPNTEIMDIGPKGSKPVSKYYKAELKAVKKIKP